MIKVGNIKQNWNEKNKLGQLLSRDINQRKLYHILDYTYFVLPTKPLFVKYLLKRSCFLIMINKLTYRMPRGNTKVHWDVRVKNEKWIFIFFFKLNALLPSVNPIRWRHGNANLWIMPNHGRLLISLKQKCYFKKYKNLHFSKMWLK